MEYKNEFDNLNLLMLQDRVFTSSEIKDIDPEILRRIVAGIIKVAEHRLRFAGIGQTARMALLMVVTEGTKALKANNHQAVVDFYDGAYRDAVNQATQSDFMKACDFNYVVNSNDKVKILEQEIVEDIDQYSAFDTAFSGTEMGLAEFQSPFEKYGKAFIAGLGIYFLYTKFMKKKV